MGVFYLLQIVIHMQKMLHNAVCSGSFGNLNELGGRNTESGEFVTRMIFFFEIAIESLAYSD